MAKLADHVRRKHNVQVPTNTIVSYIRGKARRG
jgi:hypothetical protein